MKHSFFTLMENKSTSEGSPIVVDHKFVVKVMLPGMKKLSPLMSQ